MKKTLLMATIALFGSSVLAQVQLEDSARKQVAACSFTEPFINLDLFEEGEKKLAVFSGQIQGEALLVGTPRVEKLNGEYIGTLEFQGAQVGKQTLILNLNKKGNNGMNDDVMDVEATLRSESGSQVIGGCDNK